MQHAIEPEGANPVLQTHISLHAQVGAYSYAVETKGVESTYTVSDGRDSLTLPIRWIFGQHSQTWVLEKDGDFYESAVSYFHLEQALASTPGDENLSPHNLTDAIGRKVSSWELLQCFNCHSTNATEGEKLTLERLRPGLACERCHDAADQHMLDALHGNFTSLPKSLKTINAEDTSEFCGQCHRTWDMAVRNHWHGPANVRFQPYRLANSRCFLGTDRRISCVACHDPHQPVNTSVEFYDAKCVACHAAGKARETAAAAAKTCPVSTSKCVTCHMPKVTLPGGHGVFTDHQIRVVRAGELYPD
jgi:Cytochrome c554 and c-prime